MHVRAGVLKRDTLAILLTRPKLELVRLIRRGVQCEAGPLGQHSNTPRRVDLEVTWRVKLRPIDTVLTPCGCDDRCSNQHSTPGCDERSKLAKYRVVIRHVLE